MELEKKYHWLIEYTHRNGYKYVSESYDTAYNIMVMINLLDDIRVKILSKAE